MAGRLEVDRASDSGGYSGRNGGRDGGGLEVEGIVGLGINEGLFAGKALRMPEANDIDMHSHV